MNAARKCPQIAIETPTAGSYTHEQLTDVLEVIAGRVRTLEAMLSNLSACDIRSAGGRDVQTAIDGALIVTNIIGAMADDAIGGAVNGGWKEWTYGPSFSKKGKAVTP